MFMMFNPQTILFEPKSDFHKQILTHIDDVPEECGNVPSNVKRTDYDILSEEQTRYYIWWSDCLRKATDILGSELIVDGSIAGEHTEGISRAV